MEHGKIIYSVPGVGSITFGAESPYYLEKFDGTSLGVSRQTSSAINLAGQKTLRTALNARTIPCELAISGIDNDGRFSYELLDRHKQEICKILNPLYQGVLTRVNRYGTYQIEASPSEVPTFEKYIGSCSKFKMNFIADSPMWRATSPKIYRIGGEYGTDIKIFNTLGVKLPFKLKGVAEAGDGLFKLTNEDTGEFIELADIIRSVDWRFELNTETCEVLTKISDDEEYQSGNFIFTFNSAVDMLISPGCNKFSLTSQNHDAELTIEVTDLYVGVA